jgi:hypothetical protein
VVFAANTPYILWLDKLQYLADIISNRKRIGQRWEATRAVPAAVAKGGRILAIAIIRPPLAL